MSTAAAAKAPAGTSRRDAAAPRTASPKSSTTRPPRAGAHGAPVSARSAVRKAAAGDDEAREEQAAYMHELKERLEKAETEAEERHKQVKVLNAQLDEALQGQAKLEERAHEEEEKVESLERVRRELTRQHRELEGIYEAERVQALQDKEHTQAREEALHGTIQRLKEAVAARHVQPDGDDEGARNRPESFAPPASVHRSDSRSNSRLIHQKDQIIEGLRLELAEYQVKLLEADGAGGGRLHELERQLLDTRMTNARLMEDNESFQLLLGEKTLNGDLSRGDFLRESSHASLADELESVGHADVETIRRLEAELAALRGENKALTLYINKIIGRLLTYQGFESVLGNDLDADDARPDRNKELPPPPPPDADQPQGFLQRAKSVAMGGPRKPRPLSMMGPPPVPAGQQSVNEDPATAPSIPLARSTSNRMPSGSYTHRRSASGVPPAAAADVVNKMVSPAATPIGPASPGLASPRNSFFGLPVSSGPGSSNPVSRVPSGQQVPTTNAIQEEGADAKGDANAAQADTPSPPRRLERSETAGPMTGKGMRPLRLVQNEQEAMQARKAANRASWFGGLFGQAQPKPEPGQEN
ncbi:hypothetical protein CC86DRAFT_374958 [Ophiobolus disseminans]|uniref:M protein, serotype 2.1 n=1 Tax=Ophiobolus disseminans TaxID=1469910 RepID=A0A6A6ZFS5_9PLEO|nr:hypothetical protein CC86DRAFT_374958 [Ophiobolus disseminans]